jgi:hypothetical protein
MILTRKDGTEVEVPAGTNLYMSKNFITNSAGEVFPLYANEKAVGNTFWDVETLPETTRRNIDTQVQAMAKEMGWTPEQTEEYRSNAYAAEKGRLNKITNNGVPLEHLKKQVDRLQDAAYPVIGGEIDTAGYITKLKEIQEAYGDAVYTIPLSDGTEFRGTVPAWMDAEMEVRQNLAIKEKNEARAGQPAPSPAQPTAMGAPQQTATFAERYAQAPQMGLGDVVGGAMGPAIAGIEDIITGRSTITGVPVEGVDQTAPRPIERFVEGAAELPGRMWENANRGVGIDLIEMGRDIGRAIPVSGGKKKVDRAKAIPTGKPSETKPMTLKAARKAGYVKSGRDAVSAIEEQEGLLNYKQRRVAEEEGYVSVPYYDGDKYGNQTVTYGVGQTGDYMDMSFKQTFKIHEQELKQIIPNYNTFPEKVQGELMQAMYRGDITGSPKTVALINAGKFSQAAKEFLNNEEYRSKKTPKSIKNRMKRVSKAIKSLQ